MTRKAHFNRSLTLAQEAEVCRRYQDGEKVKALCEAFGCGTRAIYNTLKRGGVKVGVWSVERDLSEADKDRICKLYRSKLSPKAIGEQFGLSEIGIRSVLIQRNVPLRSYSEAARAASRPEFEAVLRDRLAGHLEAKGFRAETEVVTPSGGSCDILVTDQFGPLLLIEVKIRKPLRGIGQLFGYRAGLQPKPEMVLAVSEALWNNSPGSSATFLRQACKEAGIALWVIASDAPSSESLTITLLEGRAPTVKAS